MGETTTNYHECEVIRNIDNISIQRIKGKWYWIYWGEKGNPIGNGLKFCPYCGKIYMKRWTETMSGTITNAQRIRNMTDEELAKFLADCNDCASCYLDEPSNCGIEETCAEAFLEWLKQPVEVLNESL